MNSSEMIFIDLETTGVDPRGDKIVQIGAILTDGSEYKTLVNPKRPIPRESTEIHGITNEMVTDAPKFSEIAEKLLEELKKAKYFVAYNLIFDFQFLQAELYESRQVFLNEQDFVFIDPYKIFKRQFPHNLSNAYKFYTGEEMNGAHDALVDVIATKKILEAQHEFNPDDFAQGYEKLAEETLGDTKILGRWFSYLEDGQIKFNQGKFKGEIVSLAHVDYLKWISRLDDITISEKRFLANFTQVKA